MFGPESFKGIFSRAQAGLKNVLNKINAISKPLSICEVLSPFFLSPSHPTHKKIPKSEWNDKIKKPINNLTFKGHFQPKPFQHSHILCSTFEAAEFVLRFLTDPENKHPGKSQLNGIIRILVTFRSVPALCSLRLLHSQLTPRDPRGPFLWLQNSSFFLFLTAKPEENAFEAIPIPLIKKPGRLWSSFISRSRDQVSKINLMSLEIGCTNRSCRVLSASDSY